MKPAIRRAENGISTHTFRTVPAGAARALASSAPDVFRNFLIDFMGRHKDKPFLAYYAMVLTHTPFTKTPHNLDTTATGIDLFPGMVDYCD